MTIAAQAVINGLSPATLCGMSVIDVGPCWDHAEPSAGDVCVV